MAAEGSPVRVVNDVPLPTLDKSVLPSGANRGGTIAAGGSAQALAPANAARVFLKGQNLSSADLWINEAGTDAAASQPSYRIPAGSTFSVNTSRAVSIWGATTGQAFSATEG